MYEVMVITIIGKLKPLVIPKIQLMVLMFKNINLILIFKMTMEFNIQIINSLLHS